MKNKSMSLILGAVVIVGITFYGGMQYGLSQAAAQAQAARQARGGFNGGRGQAGGGFTGGSIISKDATSITIQTQGGSTKIALLSPTTQISKMVSGTLADLTIGENVAVNGSANSDGSVTAETIQIRPATMRNYTSPTTSAGQTNQ